MHHSSLHLQLPFRLALLADVRFSRVINNRVLLALSQISWLGEEIWWPETLGKPINAQQPSQSFLLPNYTCEAQQGVWLRPAGSPGKPSGQPLSLPVCARQGAHQSQCQWLGSGCWPLMAEISEVGKASVLKLTPGPSESVQCTETTESLVMHKRESTAVLSSFRFSPHRRRRRRSPTLPHRIISDL